MKFITLTNAAVVRADTVTSVVPWTGLLGEFMLTVNADGVGIAVEFGDIKTRNNYFKILMKQITEVMK